MVNNESKNAAHRLNCSASIMANRTTSAAFRAGIILIFSLHFCHAQKPCARPGARSADHFGIKFEQPFDPKKQPVLFIHGLFSDAETWNQMVKALRKDPETTQRFQFWFYQYESGTPTVGAAALLKLELDATIRNIEATHGISMDRRLVVVGHSLGGILAKSLISDTGDALWNAAFSAPIDEFHLTDEQKNLLSTAFIYQPRTYIEKTIFLATPHQGSRLASGLTGKIATSIAPRSARVEALIEAVRGRNRHLIHAGSECLYENNISSIQTLRRDSPIRQLLADLPIDPEAEFHSISGLKNRRLSKGDGVVPIESTRVHGAYCEIGIFSRHQIHKREETFRLVNLMLKTDFRKIPDETVIKRLSLFDFAFVRFRGLLL